jgi:hypothetical protein
MDTKEMKDIAAKKALQKLLDLKAVDETPEIQTLQAKDADRRALVGRNASHKAQVADFDAGHALTRAVNSYRVKRTVADLAKSEGRTLSGAAIVVPEPKAEVESETVSA